MHHKKGFTLVELLAVIVILSIILIIAIPNILGIINKTKTDAYEKQMELIINASKKYMIQNETNLTWDGNVTTVTLQELQTAGIIDSNLKNPRGGVFPSNTRVTITKTTDGDTGYFIATPNELRYQFTKVNAGANGTFEYKNGSNRYIGANPNNWIEFGSENGNALLWRVIKADNEGIQIIYEGYKNSPANHNGRIIIDSLTSIPWDATGGTYGSNKWERPADLKAKLNNWYNNLTINSNYISPINWCIGASGQGINYPTDQVPTSHYLATECVDGNYSGGIFLGKTSNTSEIGLIRVSDYLSASSVETCGGSTFNGPGSAEVDNGNHCGKIINEAGRTNYLWKSTYHWWTFNGIAPRSEGVWLIYSGGSVSSNSAYALVAVRPIINLKPDILYNSGSGLISTPYTVQ